MRTPLKCNIKEFWDLPLHKRPQSIQELALALPTKNITGLWELRTEDAHTGELLERLWARNIVVDNGALNALKNIFAATGGAITPYNVISIATDAPSTKLTASLSAGSITSISVNALTATLLSGSQIIIGYGTANATTATLSAQANATDTTISVNSVNIPVGGIPINADVVPVPVVTDNPSGSPTGSTYQSLVGGDYVYTPGSGAGNRLVTITKQFLGASTPAATYTSCRLSNANPIVAGSVGVTLYLPQFVINLSTNQTLVAVIKL